MYQQFLYFVNLLLASELQIQTKNLQVQQKSKSKLLLFNQMDYLQRLNLLRQKYYKDNTQPQLNTILNVKHTSQSQRFNEATSILASQIKKCDQLFLKFSTLDKVDIELYRCYFQLMQKQFELLYSDQTKFRPSISVYAENVSNNLLKQKIVCLAHNNNRSEIFQLVIGLLLLWATQKKQQRIILYTSKEQLQTYSKYFGYKRLNDSVNTNFESLLEKINNLNIRYFQEEFTHTPEDSNCIVIFDIFSVPKTAYGAIYRYVTSKKWYKSMLIYTFEQTDLQYDQILEMQNGFPYEKVHSSNLKQTVLQTLEQAKVYAEKIDIVIFSIDPENEKCSFLQIFKSRGILVNIITNDDQEYNLQKANIFISINSKQLSSWKYYFNNVVAVFDSGLDSKIYFQLQNGTYVQTIQQIDQQEMRMRKAFLGKIKAGKYFQMFDWRPSEKKHFLHQDLSGYVLNMLSFGFTVNEIKSQKNIIVNQLIQKTIDSLVQLKIMKTEDNKNYEIIIKKNEISCCPLHYFSIFLHMKQKQLQTNIIVYFLALMMTPKTLKKTENKNLHQIWKKTGDLTSCIQILYEYDLQTQRKKISNKNHKKQQPNVQMSEIKKFIKQLEVDEVFLNKCMKNIIKIRRDAKIPFSQIPNLQALIQKFIEITLQLFKNAAIYTGSRRFGYLLKSGKNSQFSKKSILSILNDHPRIVIPFKLYKPHNGQHQIIFCEKLIQSQHLGVLGQISLTHQSSAFKDSEIEFTKVSNSMFQELQRSLFIEQIEKKYECMVQTNIEISSIIIFCSKQSREAVQSELNQFFESTRQRLQNQTKSINYHSWDLLFQRGGAVKQIIHQNNPKIVNLINIPISATDNEISQYISQYADIQSIEVFENVVNQTKTARIIFSSIEDRDYTIQQLNNSIFKGSQIKFDKQNKASGVRKISQQNFVKFKWFVSPLTKRGLGVITFATPQQAKNASEVFNQTFDGKEVGVTIQNNKLHLSGLNEHTDQIYLRSHLSVFGDIQNVELQKQSCQQVGNSQSLVEYLIKQFTTPNERFQVIYLKKQPFGQRVAKIKMLNLKSIQILSNALNETNDLIGKTRLYIEPEHTYPILVQDQKSQKLYYSLLLDSLKQLKIPQKLVTIQILQQQNMRYILLKSRNYDALALLSKIQLKEFSIQLNDDDKQFFFSEVGKKSLNLLEDIYTCKFVSNKMTKQLGLISKPNDQQLIIKEVMSILSNVTEQRIICSTKTYKNLCENTIVLNKIKEDSNLEEITINHITKQIIIKGFPLNLKQARQNILFHLQSIHSLQKDDNPLETCGICCQKMSRPYRLQICSHTFCEQCLIFSINNSLSDVSCFPIKCPHCLNDVAIKDLSILLDTQKWKKLTTISVNQYLGRNADKFGCCYTPNCEGIYIVDGSDYECNVCLKSYCMKCQSKSHPDLTCQQAKDDTILLFKKYMQDFDVRICPNKSCRMQLQKIDGCNKVLCSRCNSAICWKCPKKNMSFFFSPQACYKHLTQKHGGYYD